MASVLTKNEMPKGTIIDTGNLIIIEFKKISIYSANFVSHESDKKREGFVKFDIGGQSTIIKYEDNNNISDKFKNKIAYFGQIPTDLSFEITLVELDEEKRGEIGRVKNISDFCAKLPNAVGAGFSVVSSLLKLWQVNVDDDIEINSYDVLNCSGLKNEQVVTYKYTRPDDRTVFEVEFLIKDIGKPSDSKKISIDIENIEFKEDKNIRGSIGIIWENMKKIIGIGEDSKILSFQASSNKINSSAAVYYKNKDSSDKNINKKVEILSWNKKHLFSVPSTTIKNKNVIPLSLNFALCNKDFNVQEIFDVFYSSINFAIALGVEEENLKKIKKEKENESITSFVTDISKENLSLYSFNGLVFLNPDDPNASHEQNSDGTIALKKMGDDNVWEGNIVKEVQLKNDRIGDFSFVLKVKGI